MEGGMSHVAQDSMDPGTLRAVEAVAEAWAQFKTDSGLADHPIVLGLEEGRTLAQIQGLSRDDLEVIYAHGFRLLSQGMRDKAEIVFTQLVMIDPLMARNHYCLGLCHQLAGDPSKALGLFEMAVALDATNPEGLIKMGECYAALNRPEDAADCFRIALAEARKGNGTEDAAARAAARLDSVSQGA
jgi:type III secretion system low calcium response chaperone LcrH/SycD